MRQTLFLISFGEPLAFWTADPRTGIPQVGVAWIILAVLAVLGIWNLWLHRDVTRMLTKTSTGIGGAGLVLSGLLKRGLAGKSIPVFGYGFFVMIGFLVGVITAERRLKKLNIDPNAAWDAGMWLLIGGVTGGRLFYLAQYHRQVYQNVKSLPEALFATINLTAGGLVLIGALCGGGLAFILFCRSRKLSMPDFADAATPSVFLGIGFGRIGCLMNGCCFGDRCELPWGISFPQGSVPFTLLADRGFVARTAPWTMPLHPTQIYSALDGFLLACITALLFAERRWKGEVFGWGCVLYSITRFLIEFLRGDEMGQLGTGLTISQLYSLGIAALGASVLVWQSRRPATTGLPSTQ